jgi:hypothetical protein
VERCDLWWSFNPQRCQGYGRHKRFVHVDDVDAYEGVREVAANPRV